MKIKKSAIKKILDAVFPSYTGRKFFLQPTEKIKFSNTNWSEGTRNTYRCYNLETGKVVSIPDFAPWANPIEGNEAALPVNALVRLSTAWMLSRMLPA